MTRSRHCEQGFTLVELLVTVVILGVIGAAITEAVFVTLRTTDGSVARISGSAASETLAAYVSADVQSADDVADPPDATCATSDPAGVFLRLRWADGQAKVVEYSFDPAIGPDQDLVRWMCVDASAGSGRVLGHFTHDGTGPPPVAIRCDGATCPSDPPGRPDKVTLAIRVDEESTPHELTVTRRTP